VVKKYRVEITQIAEADLQEIHRYISIDNQIAADQLLNDIERQIDSLEKFPLRSPVIPEAKELGRDYRQIIYGNDRTIFRIDGARVIIMRIIHGARLLSLQVFEK
jgi:toxin ParE1/3/4